MSIRCKNSAGGSEPSSPSILDDPLPSSSAAGKASKAGYKSRLRPRPTRQTEYFRSPASKRKILSNTDLLPHQSVSEPILSIGSVPVPAVRQTRASFLREQANLASTSKGRTTSLPEKRHLNSSEPSLAAKRARSKVSYSSKANKNPRKAVSQESLHRNQEETTKVKEIQSKLWYPFIPPGTSSESEEEDNFQEIVGSSSATSGSAKKLASRSKSSKSSAKESSALPSTSTTKLSSNSESKGQPKPSASKSTGRFSLGRFSKSESAKAETTKEGSNSQSSVQSSSSSQSGVRTRSAISKHSKSAKGKSSGKSRDDENKSKSRKRYQSPPNHPLYSRSSVTTSTKTGSCASASRRGRGKPSSGNPREQEEPSPAVPVMSRDAARSSGDEQGNVPQDPAAENQGGSPAAPAVPADNASSPDVEFDDPDMSRFQALLEARGLPTHFFGTLGPRVQQIFNRSMNNGRSSKAQLLLQGMQATGDESCQLQSVIEMCQLLVMGNEDTLSGFPTKMVVPALITLLKMEHNFDMMNHACRALTYMMEALPRSASVVVDAVPAFLEKLQSIQCMDVAEQSLTALEMLSRRHGASILRANGLSSCLLYLDFFSLPAQRNALTVAANCCSVLTPSDQRSEFDKYYGSSISLLAQRLSHHDKKCVESICLCFARLVDNFHNQPEILQNIANDGLLKNFQNLLVVTPPLIGSNTFVMVIRTMSLLCSSCPDLATQLVKHNIADTLRYLLCGTAADNEDIELVPRGPQELYEITSLIGELMPRLPLDDPMFSVDRLLKQSSKKSDHHHPTWQWRGDEGSWHPYSKHDNRMIEEAHRSGDNEASLLIQSRVYMLDFTVMQQINEDTGNSRAIRRYTDAKENKPTVVKTESDNSMTDARVSLVKDDREVVSGFVRSLFTVLYEVYGSSAGSPAVRHKCLRAVQRMIYYAEPELLRDVLKNLSVSSHIASMLSSTDLKVIVGALQMAMILMNKLPEVFEVYFRRQGVTHQVEQLLDKNHKVVGVDRGGSPPTVPADQPPSNSATPIFEGAPSSTDPSPSDPSTGRLSDILRRKYPPRKSAGKRLSSSSSLTPTPEDNRQVSGRHRGDLSSPTDRVISPPLTKAKAFAAAMSTADGATDTPTGPKSKSGSNSRSSASSFFFNLNPTRWRRSFPSSASVSASPTTTSHVQSLLALTSSSAQAARAMRENLTLPNLQKNTGSKENKEQVKQWVREQAKLFLDKYFALEDISEQLSDEGAAEDASLIKQLTNIAQSLVSSMTISDACDTLRAFCDIISTSDVSSFELQHSGIVTSLTAFLTQEAEQSNKQPDSSKRKSPPTPPMITRRRSKPDPGAQTPDLDRVSAMEHDRADSASSTDASRLTRRSLKVHGDEAAQIEASGTDTAKKAPKWNAPFISLDRDERLRNFLNVFVGLPDTQFSNNLISATDSSDVEPLRNLVSKLNLCINQLEQFSVKFQDLPSAPGRGVQALNFFSRHQLKCRLQRSPNCNKSKQWYGGPVRVDPLALVQAIERHLISRGYGAASSSDGNDTPQRREALMMMGDDDDSEDEIEVDDEDVGPPDLPTGGSTQDQSSSPSSTNKHRLELYLGTNKLPYNMTVYQAVKHFSENSAQSSSLVMTSSDRDTDDESMSLSNASLWSEVHTIHYKLVSDTSGSSSVTTASGKKGTQKISPKLSKKQDSLFLHGIVSPLPRPLDKYLVDHLPSSFVTSDPSKEVLCLLRIVFGLTIHWHSLYNPSALKNDRELISKSDFVNNKLSTKAHRQLQDPLMIMTGDLPPWLSELTHSCPFVLPFETRQLFFRIVSFDRDRAMQYLLDTGALPELTSPSSGAASSSHDAANRFVPKIEKKKCVVKRENLLQQAEKLLHDHGNARSLLEIQYEGEVGTGLGPTLEFYTLASHELQRADLCLWRSDEKSSSVENRNAGPPSLKKMVKKLTEIVDTEEVAPMPLETSFVHSPVGLYPLPIGRTTKLSSIAKPKSKFSFLGKFLAKSAMDGRLADIPLSIVCYKWLLGKENEITWFDLEQVDPGFTLTFNKLKSVLHQRTALENEPSVDMEEKRASITMDGCSLEDLGLDFLLPGFPNIELMKGGTKTSLSINNIDKYLCLIAHWTLIEGVRHQLDAVKEGFNSVFSLRTIDYFFPEELDELFCGARYQPWSERELADCCRTDHGYNHDSETVRTLFRVLSQYDVAEQRAFLQFVTGSPHLPVGGFKALHPQLTIVRKSSEEGHSPDEYLPSVMTCVNYLKLPEYSSETIMRQRLSKATREGQKSFLLS